MKIEEVTSVEAPPKARVQDVVEESPRESFERKRDYLDGFLKAEPPKLAEGEPGGDLYEAVIAALKDIFDPEIRSISMTLALSMASRSMKGMSTST